MHVLGIGIHLVVDNPHRILDRLNDPGLILVEGVGDTLVESCPAGQQQSRYTSCLAFVRAASYRSQSANFGEFHCVRRDMKIKRIFLSFVLSIVLLFAAVILACFSVKSPCDVEQVFGDLKVGELWDQTADVIDDWYAISELAPNTYAITEFRSSQYNISYLIEGEKKAILFDTGSGERPESVRSMDSLVAGLTDTEIVVMVSHFHFDHTGDIEKFDGVTMIDLPYLRAGVSEDVYDVSFFENLAAQMPKLTISSWVKHNESIDLGGRLIQVINTPGHTRESITLLDHTNRVAFTGDLLYQHLGGIVAFAPGGDLDAYIGSLDTLVASTDGESYRYFGAHGLPEFEKEWAIELKRRLLGIRDGTETLRYAAFMPAPSIPMRLCAHDQMLIYLLPFSNPAFLFSWRSIALLVCLVTGVTYFVQATWELLANRRSRPADPVN